MIIHEVLKRNDSPSTPALTKIFQACIHQGQTAEDWRSANISPILKKGAGTRANLQSTDQFP
jgi:hypothetical protein